MRVKAIVQHLVFPSSNADQVVDLPFFHMRSGEKA
jgi:hypothetical protein